MSLVSYDNIMEDESPIISLYEHYNLEMRSSYLNKANKIFLFDISTTNFISMVLLHDYGISIAMHWRYCSLVLTIDIMWIGGKVAWYF